MIASDNDNDEELELSGTAQVTEGLSGSRIFQGMLLMRDGHIVLRVPICTFSRTIPFCYSVHIRFVVFFTEHSVEFSLCLSLSDGVKGPRAL